METLSQREHITALFAIALYYWITSDEQKAEDTIYVALLFSQTPTMSYA